MKKRVFSLLMVGAMLLGSSICAFAEEPAIVVDSTMIDDSVYEGTWVEFFDAFDLYLPTGWTEQQLAEGNEEEGIAYVLADDAGDMIAVSYVDYGDAEVTLEEIAGELSNSYDSVEQWTVNDIPTLVFGNDDSQWVDFAALDDQGGLIQVSMVAAEEGADPSWTLNVIASFSKAEIQEAESETE